MTDNLETLVREVMPLLLARCVVCAAVHSPPRIVTYNLRCLLKKFPQRVSKKSGCSS